MPVLFQFHVVREDLCRNRGVLYTFGDNTARRGYGGQAKQMRGEPNAVGVRVKYAPSMESTAFFGEEPAEIIAQQRMIDEDFKRLFEHVKAGGVVIWPTRGIGTERAELPARAPSTFDYIKLKLAALLKAAELFHKEAPA
jgi:hypothetical protein